MLQFLEAEGPKICNRLYDYAYRWKQPINIGKTVYQIFHSRVNRLPSTTTMRNTPLEYIKDLTYLGCRWTSKLAIYKSVSNCLVKVQKSYVKLKSLKLSRGISTEVLEQCFFACSMPLFAWLFGLFTFLSSTQQQLLRRTFRVGLRLVRRCIGQQHMIYITLQNKKTWIVMWGNPFEGD